MKVRIYKVERFYGLTSSDNRDAYTYNYILYKYIICTYTCHLRATQTLAWARMALNVALRAMSHPRGSRAIK